MEPIRLRKIKDNAIGFEEIIILEKNLSRVIECPSLPHGDSNLPGKVYEYEYLCICLGDGDSRELINFTEDHFTEIMMGYEVLGLERKPRFFIKSVTPIKRK